MNKTRTERDSMGEIEVPSDRLWGAHTQRALENFPVNGVRFSRPFLRALALIKKAAAQTHADLELIDGDRAQAIETAAEEVAGGKWDDHFPLDVFQTGSGTSTNMNMNEVLARRAEQILANAGPPLQIHPNDHVNLGQSSNDVIPTVIHVSATLETVGTLLPELGDMIHALRKKAHEASHVIKTGRTHLMDAMPISAAQEINGWAYQMQQAIERIETCLPRLVKLPLGGTAVGTGLNTHPEFASQVAGRLEAETGQPFTRTENHFAVQSCLDTPAELSSHLRTTATALMKIADDLRWSASGPGAGLAEITLPALQPGSSIMPGKVNPVICESVMMACAQIMGNDVTIGMANSRGNFQLNTMLPLIGHNLLQSIQLLSGAIRSLTEKVIPGIRFNVERALDPVERNPVLVTALNPIIGYEKAAAIARKAYAENRTIKEVALAETDLVEEQIDRLLDPARLIEGGWPEPPA